MVAPGGCAWLLGGRGVRGCSWGGMHGCSRGGVRGCSGGACVGALGEGMRGCSPGGMRGCSLGGVCMVAPGGGMCGCSGGACMVAPGGVPGCSGGMHGCSGGHAWDTTRYGDTVNERAVRILLECILVFFYDPHGLFFLVTCAHGILACIIF